MGNSKSKSAWHTHKAITGPTHVDVTKIDHGVYWDPKITVKCVNKNVVVRLQSFAMPLGTSPCVGCDEGRTTRLFPYVVRVRGSQNPQNPVVPSVLSIISEAGSMAAGCQACDVQSGCVLKAVMSCLTLRIDTFRPWTITS